MTMTASRPPPPKPTARREHRRIEVEAVLKSEQPVRQSIAQRAQARIEIADRGDEPAPIDGGRAERPEIGFLDHRFAILVTGEFQTLLLNAGDLRQGKIAGIGNKRPAVAFQGLFDHRMTAAFDGKTKRAVDLRPHVIVVHRAFRKRGRDIGISAESFGVP